MMYPDADPVVVSLSGPSGNAFAVLAGVKKSMTKAGADQSEWEIVHDAMTSGDYENLLAEAAKVVPVAVID